MERHPLGSQAFLPLNERPYLIVVATPGELSSSGLRAFATRGWQGVNYARGVWHHALLALEETGDFVVIDRGGEGPNLDEEALQRTCLAYGESRAGSDRVRLAVRCQL